MRPDPTLALIVALGICACDSAAIGATTATKPAIMATGTAPTATRTATTATARTAAGPAVATAMATSFVSPRPVMKVVWRPDEKLMLLPVRLNRLPPAWFVLDSGAPHSVVDPRLAREAGLKKMATSSVTGTGKGQVGVEHVGPVTLEIQGLKLAVEDPWVIDLSGVPIDKSVRGLIGQDLLARYVVRLDPRTRTLEAFEPKAWTPPKTGAVLPLIVENGRLYLEARLEVKPGLSATHRLRVDTGSGDFVNDPLVAQSTQTTTTLVGQGLGESYQAVSGVYDAVHFGPYVFRKAWGPGGDNPAVGMELFRRFVVTFDLPGRRLHLEPLPAILDPVPSPAAEVVVSPG